MIPLGQGKCFVLARYSGFDAGRDTEVIEEMRVIKSKQKDFLQVFDLSVKNKNVT